MTTANLVLCETGQQWAMALRWSMSDADQRRVISIPLDHFLESMADHQQAVVGLELTRERFDDVIPLIIELQRRGIPVVVFATREFPPGTSVLYELGATHVVQSPRNLTPVIRLIRRCAEARTPTYATPRESVWARMPWQPT